MLSIKNLVKKFHDKVIIDDFSVVIQPGEILVLLGGSGVGKSTVLRIVSNLEQANFGMLELDGQQLDFKNVGMVFQDFNLFTNLTVLENLVYPLVHVAKIDKIEAEQKALAVMAKFNIDQKANVYPSSLSGGQKQRVAIARALCMEPKVICLDEPTSALDPMLTADVGQIIQNLASQGIIIIIATHDISLLENLVCTICLMKDGKIIEKATTEQLKNQPEMFMQIQNFMQGKNNLV
jgi:polar amino acid transport system ATP-binding protein